MSFCSARAFNFTGNSSGNAKIDRLMERCRGMKKENYGAATARQQRVMEGPQLRLCPLPTVCISVFNLPRGYDA